MIAGVLAALFATVGAILTTASSRITGGRILKWQIESAAESCFIFAALFLMVFGFRVLTQ